MRHKRHYPFKRFIGALLVAAATLVPVAADSGPDNSQHDKPRFAPDLKASIGKKAPGETIRVVINLDRVDRGKLDDKLREIGGVLKGHYPRTKQAVVELPADRVESLQEVDGLDYIAPDRPVDSLASHLQTTTGASQAYGLGGLLGALTGTTLDGRGVGVAVLDSGIDYDHFDLRLNGQRRVIVNADFTGNKEWWEDPYGHGTHVAGIIAGDGSSAKGAGFDYAGVAPGAYLLNLRVLDPRGRGAISNVIAAIDYAIANKSLYNIRVLNLSLAAPPIDSYRDDPLCQAVARASEAGIVVVVSAGNFGVDALGRKVYGGITSPANSPAVITVGATRTGWTDKRSDDRVAPFSSRGPTLSSSPDPATGEPVFDSLPKPDLVAPGVSIVSTERYDNYLLKTYPVIHVDTGDNATWHRRYMRLSGTSMSAGVVSGAVALMLQANPTLTPNMVKAILMFSAQRIEGADLFEQGAGALNVEGAVRLAASMRPRFGTPATGQKLIYGPLPAPVTRISGETFAWGQSLIWGRGLLDGAALMTSMQEVYAQSLIWGFSVGGYAWSAGVTLSDGMFSDEHVVSTQNGQWETVHWDGGTSLANGLTFRDDLYASGVPWRMGLITDQFFTLDPASLIWGIYSYGYSLNVWGVTPYAEGSALIWGYTGGWM